MPPSAEVRPAALAAAACLRWAARRHGPPLAGLFCRRFHPSRCAWYCQWLLLNVMWAMCIFHAVASHVAPACLACCSPCPAALLPQALPAAHRLPVRLARSCGCTSAPSTTTSRCVALCRPCHQSALHPCLLAACRPGPAWQLGQRARGLCMSLAQGCCPPTT